MAEVLSDAIADITGISDKYTELALNDGSTEKVTAYGANTRALQLYDSAVKSYFLKTFGRNQREITCECERSNQPSLVQALHLSNGSTLNQKLSSKDGRVAKLLAENPSPAAIIESAYQLCLSRSPREEERRQFEQILNESGGGERQMAVEDLFWSLLTSREFLFQH